MRKIEKMFLTEKEASHRYGYSRSWFRNKRYQNERPLFIKVKAKILYPLYETDIFFKIYQENDGSMLNHSQ